MKTTIRLIIPVLLLVTLVQAQSVAQSNNTRISLDSIDINDVESKESSLVDKNDMKTEMSKVFYENAKRAGLSQEKTNELIKIIQERNKSLKYLDTWKEQYDDSYTLEDREMLGHKNIKTTQIYTKIIDEKKRETGGLDLVKIG